MPEHHRHSEPKFRRHRDRSTPFACVSRLWSFSRHPFPVTGQCDQSVKGILRNNCCLRWSFLFVSFVDLWKALGQGYLPLISPRPNPRQRPHLHPPPRRNPRPRTRAFVGVVEFLTWSHQTGDQENRRRWSPAPGRFGGASERIVLRAGVPTGCWTALREEAARWAHPKPI
jgi:hypothetical protein